MEREGYYTAGPMRGHVDYNFPAFDECRDYLLECGMGPVFNPADNDRKNGFEGIGMTGTEDLTAIGFSVANAMAWDLDVILNKAAGIVLLPGWEESKGARLEKHVAETAGLHIMTYDPTGSWGNRLWDYEGPKEAHVVPDDPRLPGYCCAPVDMPLQPAERDLLTETVFDGTVFDPAPRAGEVRVTDPATGGQKGSKASQVSHLDPLTLLRLGEVAGMGAAKYTPYNFMQGYAWSLSFNAALRHALQFWAGEDLDPESGIPHAYHAAWNFLALGSFLDRGLGTDDRPPRKGA